MANSNKKHPLNQDGRFFTDLDCIDCGLCIDLAPQVFRRDDEDGYAYIHRQPTTPAEFEATQVALDACPMESIGEQ